MPIFFEKHPKITGAITLVIAATIFYMSSLSFYTTSSSGFAWQAYAYHFGIFFLLTACLLITLIRGKYVHYLSVGIFISFLYSVLDEIHQIYVPGRFFSLVDIVINSIGILTAAGVYVLILKKRKRISLYN